MYFEGACVYKHLVKEFAPWGDGCRGPFLQRRKKKKIKSDSWDEAFKQQGAGHNGEKQKQFHQKINFEVETNM